METKTGSEMGTTAAPKTQEKRFWEMRRQEILAARKARIRRMASEIKMLASTLDEFEKKYLPVSAELRSIKIQLSEALKGVPAFERRKEKEPFVSRAVMAIHELKGSANCVR